MNQHRLSNVAGLSYNADTTLWPVWLLSDKCFSTLRLEKKKKKKWTTLYGDVSQLNVQNDLVSDCKPTFSGNTSESRTNGSFKLLSSPTLKLYSVLYLNIILSLTTTDPGEAGGREWLNFLAKLDFKRESFHILLEYPTKIAYFSAEILDASPSSSPINYLTDGISKL